MKRITAVCIVLLLLAAMVSAQEIELEVGPDMYIDADGWQPFQEAFNLMPYAGGVSIVFGIVNLVQDNTTAGWIQIILGAGLLIGGLLLP